MGSAFAVGGSLADDGSTLHLTKIPNNWTIQKTMRFRRNKHREKKTPPQSPKQSNEYNEKTISIYKCESEQWDAVWNEKSEVASQAYGEETCIPEQSNNQFTFPLCQSSMVLKVSSRIKHPKKMQGKIQDARGRGMGFALIFAFASGPSGKVLRLFA